MREYTTSETLWFRLYTHALLRESRILPNLELYDESPGYSCDGFADTWKGNYRGELVCIKAIRLGNQVRLREIEKARDRFIFSELYSVCSVPDLSS